MTTRNKVFTKVFEADIGTSIGPIETINDAELTWLLQEDISIFAVDGVAVTNKPSENDGFTRLIAELSQTAVFGSDGALMAVAVSEGWNTTPSGIFATASNKSLTLPQGKAIIVREEGHLYVNCSTYGKTAGITHFQYRFTIYYTKG
ncbi:hypothetical protein ES705_34705 [subsurface metagenome]